MKVLLSLILGFLLTQVSSQAAGVQTQQAQEKLHKLSLLEDKLEVLYDELEYKAQEILPPLKKLNVQAMGIDDLVEIQKILAPIYALDKRLSYYPRKFRRPLSQQDLPRMEKELDWLKKEIKNL